MKQMLEIAALLTKASDRTKCIQEEIFVILKSADPKNTEELERLLAIAPASVKPRIEQELRAIRSGIKGESESAYILDSTFAD